MKVQATENDLYSDDNLGGCTGCGNLQGGCEPDARNYECEECGKRLVFGLEELALMGELEVVGEDETDDTDNEEV